ncbi:aspartyl-phosphate phosphatase Spo0E family protein [Ureibacillus sp. NPDC094379]
MNNTLQRIHCLKEIEKLRSELITCGMEKGLTHPTTIEISQSLDKKLNEYSLLKASTKVAYAYNSTTYQSLHLNTP